MCGIHASLSKDGVRTSSPELKLLLGKRGPDHTGTVESSIEKDGISYSLSFTSTVLALRGGHVTTQPFVDPRSGSVLCWNGEAWKIGSQLVVGNDGQGVFDALLRATSEEKCASKAAAAVLKGLNSIYGPFAFVFLNKSHKQIFFGRDRLGRRSLLHNCTPDYMEFSSTADPARGNWQEVEADAVYMLSCSHERPLHNIQDQQALLISSAILPLQKYFWEVCSDPAVSSLGTFNREVSPGRVILNSQSDSVKILRLRLCESLKLRVLNIPGPPKPPQTANVRAAILFSGGLDCSVLARMAHDLLPLDHQIDLINVAFENPRVIQAAKNTKISGKQLAQAESNQDVVIREGMERISPYETCPDRETGRKAFQELQNVCPNRIWRFVAVNVPYTETMAHRAKIVNLIHPHNTEMDLSIAYALYFAARGTGLASLNLNTHPEIYTTPARVLLSGLGADELFGGYTRHATAFNRKSFSGLLDELELDVNRLGKRNLGRDDRVISHWGREARFPYLDESLVKWAVESPIWEKCGFTETAAIEQEIPNLEPGKKVLRLLAYELGMHSVAQEKKRAIQFGARTAKMEIGRTKGTTLIS